MNQQQREELLINIHREQQEMKEHQNKTDEVLMNIYREQQDMKEHQNKTDEILMNIYREQQEMKEHQNKTDEVLADMKGELTRLGYTVAKIEIEHGRKIDLILDVLTGHTDKLEEHDKRFEKDEKLIEMQGHRIYALEQRKKA